MWRRLLLAVATAAVVAPMMGSAVAQVPPHRPGTICFTRYFWCWAQPPGPANTPCTCPSPQGLVRGVRG